MAAMFFGQYLLSKGVIDREALIDAIERQRRSNLSLPQLAVREGMLEPAQADEILARYRTSDVDLEELCVRSGHLQSGQFEKLTRIQRADWVRIGSALVAGGHLSQNEVEKRLADFREMERAADQRLEADFMSCREPGTVKTCVELSMFHVGRLTDKPVKLRSLTAEADGRLATGRRRYGQKLVGDRDLVVALDLPSELAAVMAERMLGIALEKESDAAVDAVCECVNMIGGNACTRLEASGLKLRPEPPFSVGADEPDFPEGACAQALIIADEAELDVRVFL
jgi:hypothetical protein